VQEWCGPFGARATGSLTVGRKGCIRAVLFFGFPRLRSGQAVSFGQAKEMKKDESQILCQYLVRIAPVKATGT